MICFAVSLRWSCEMGLLPIRSLTQSPSAASRASEVIWSRSASSRSLRPVHRSMRSSQIALCWVCWLSRIIWNSAREAAVEQVSM